MKMLHIIISFVIAASFAVGCDEKDGTSEKEHRAGVKTVFVSILPHKFLVERLVADRADVHVMVGPGRNPALYEPTPGQMRLLSGADLYFSSGVPFESVWLPRLKKSNPDVRFVDVGQGIEKRHISSPFESEQHHDHKHQRGKPDPHIWLDPVLMKQQARTVAKALISDDPTGEAFYRKRLATLLRDLSQLHSDIVKRLAAVKQRTFMVFHPSWGYFAERYDFRQIPVEVRGKRPGTKTLARVIDYAKTHTIPVILVQKQFDTSIARSIEQQTDAAVISPDPLASNYIQNMRRIADMLGGALTKNGAKERP